MMKALRAGLAIVMLAVLALGYAASQYSYAQGVEAAAAYAERVNTPAVALVSLLLLALTAIFAFLGADTTEEPIADRKASEIVPS